MVWVLLMISVLVGTLAFTIDVGMIQDDKSQAQTVADAAALAGINVVRRVFAVPTASMSAYEKAGYVRAAVLEAAGNAGFAASSVQIIYCPRSSEAAVLTGGGPCFSITNPGSISTVTKPSPYYPLDSEAAGEDEEGTAAYLHVVLSKNTTSYFARILDIMNFPPVTVSAMTRYKEDVQLPCPGFYAPREASNDPLPLNLKNGSNLTLINGGILISDDANNSIGGSAPINSVTADWIKSAGGTSHPANVSYTCNLGGTCPEMDLEANLLVDYEYDPPSDIGIDCASTSYPNTAGNKCDRYTVNSGPHAGHYVYKNCLVDNTMVASGAYTLYAGTYCGGLTITNVQGSANNPRVILQPRVSSGEIVEDVYYFTGGDMTVTGDKHGPTVTYSYIQARNGGVADGGIVLYAPMASGSSAYAVALQWAQFTALDPDPDVLSAADGSLRIFSDNLQLDDSTLTYNTYKGGLSECGGESQSFTGLVQ